MKNTNWKSIHKFAEYAMVSSVTFLLMSIFYGVGNLPFASAFVLGTMFVTSRTLNKKLEQEKLECDEEFDWGDESYHIQRNKIPSISKVGVVEIEGIEFNFKMDNDTFEIEDIPYEHYHIFNKLIMEVFDNFGMPKMKKDYAKSYKGYSTDGSNIIEVIKIENAFVTSISDLDRGEEKPFNVTFSFDYINVVLNKYKSNEK